MKDLRTICEEFCGVTIDPANNTSACPFAGTLHDSSDGDRAVIWHFDDPRKPRAHCFHTKCAEAFSALMSDLHHHIFCLYRAEKGGPPATDAETRDRLPAAPKEHTKRVLPCDHLLAARIAALNPLEEISEQMLLDASPVAIPADPATHGALLIDTLYSRGEHILVVTAFPRQGQYLHTAGTAQFYRLGNRPGVQAVHSPRLPAGGPEGVWYLVQPVSGTWQPNPNKRDKDGNLMLGRRHAQCCTRFPYAVLESDTIAPEVWLRILTQLHDPIAAIYTSGGKSIHALIKVDAASAEEFNLHRANLIRRLAPVGADPAALTAVRLSRLPGCLRNGCKDKDGNLTTYDKPRLQRLLYLNPNPEKAPLYTTLKK